MILTKEDLKLLVDTEKYYNYSTISSSNYVLPNTLNIQINETLNEDIILMSILPEAENCIFENYNIDIKYNGEATEHTIICLQNNAKRLTIRNCRITFTSTTQVNFTAIKNYGGVITHLETPADGLEISGCRFDIRVLAESFPFNNKVCGVENILANSMSIRNNYIFVKTNGDSNKQCAYGIINSGRFARIENNNIKANASHNQGILLEAAHAFGVYNEGLYMIFTGNNCIAEWGGKCVSLYINSEFCTISGNKILSTHTICGRSVVLAGAKNVVNGNVITSTSRNHHIIEVFAGHNTITNNYIQALIRAISGCGIYVEGTLDEPIMSCIIKDNHITSAKDYGIAMLYTKNNIITDNIIRASGTGYLISDIFHTGKDGIKNSPATPVAGFHPRNYERNIKSYIE